MVELIIDAATAHLIWNGMRRGYILGWGEYSTVFDEPGATNTFDFCYEVQFRTDPHTVRERLAT